MRKSPRDVLSAAQRPSGDHAASLLIEGGYTRLCRAVSEATGPAFDTHLPEEGLRRETVLFGTSGLQVLGGPSWMSSDHFDIEAKPPAYRIITQSEMQLMVQSLLEDRFQLKSHYESREVPVYHLVLVKEGKMKRSEDQTSGPSDEKRTIGGFPLRRGGSTLATLGKPEPGARCYFTWSGMPSRFPLSFK